MRVLCFLLCAHATSARLLFSSNNASAADYAPLNWTMAASLGKALPEYNVTDDGVVAAYVPGLLPDGYYTVVGVRPRDIRLSRAKPVEVLFRARAFLAGREFDQGYGYTFTVWLFHDSAVDPHAIILTFHTGIPPHKLVDDVWQDTYPKFTERVDDRYGTCLAHIFERDTFVTSPCVYVDGTPMDMAAVDDKFDHTSPTFAFRIVVDANGTVATRIEQEFANGTEVIVDHANAVVMEKLRVERPHGSDTPVGFAVGTVLASLEITDLEIYGTPVDVSDVDGLPIDATPTTTAEAANTTTVTAVQGEWHPGITTPSTSTTTTTTTVPTAPVTDHTNIAHASTTGRDGTPLDHDLIIALFAAAGVCLIVIVGALCFSRASLRIWSNMINAKRSVGDLQVTEHDNNEDMSETEVLPAKIRVSSEYGRLPTRPTGEYETADVAKGGQQRPTIIYDANVPTSIYEQASDSLN